MSGWKLPAALFAFVAAPALAAGAANFTIVNATGLNIETLEIRRFGTAEWRPLPARPPSGGRGQVDFSDPDCAFDIRAKLSGGVDAVWPGVNLCEAKSVTLNRSARGALWVDYD
ncbi:hypothetical protein G7077_02610 [Sphingomonas piscis]|uniref:Uncharacterized protein n=1 Tax=Sphingomonas piscis TaxID=2714943 RepID=A0A6G7YMJ7_9SPHN|nr:hypothetical protein [Sphingomonas piscis]QIK77969.1 hypothetical protein G7077_02610 [Sphingomonas piscis]